MGGSVALHEPRSKKREEKIACQQDIIKRTVFVICRFHVERRDNEPSYGADNQLPETTAVDSGLSSHSLKHRRIKGSPVTSLGRGACGCGCAVCCACVC